MPINTAQQMAAISAHARRLHTLVDSARRGSVPVDQVRGEAKALKAQLNQFLEGLPA